MVSRQVGIQSAHILARMRCETVPVYPFSAIIQATMRSQVFDDFDAFAESVRDVDSKMLLRNPQRRVWSTSSVDLGCIDVQLGKLGSGNIAMGELRTDGYMLYLPLSNTVEYSANGAVLPKKSFAILEPGCEFCISTKVEHDWCVAFIPTELLEGDRDLGARASRSCHVTRPNRRAADEFRAALLQVFDAAACTPHFESSYAARRAAEEVLRAAKLIVAPTQPEAAGTSSGRATTIAMAVPASSSMSGPTTNPVRRVCARS